MNCTHCEHYHNNDCYFPKTEIDKNEEDRKELSTRINSLIIEFNDPFSILMSLYYKAKFGVNMPVICCSCYSSLEKGTFQKNSKRRILLFSISLITSLYFLFTYMAEIMSFTWVSILLFAVPFSFWGYISFKDIESIIYLHRGRKNYDKIMNAQSYEDKNKEKSRREKLLDKEDRENPKEGAYYSSGYEY